GTPQLVSAPTVPAEKRTDNGGDVVWNGANWVAVYNQWARPWAWDSPRGGCDDVFARLLDPDGTPAAGAVNINDDGSTTATNALWWNMWPVAIWTGANVVAFYEDARHDRSRDYVMGHLLTATGGRIGNDVRLDDNGTRVTQKFPAAAWTGTEIGVAWQDDRDGGFEIYFRRFDSSLLPIGGSVRVTNAIGTSRVPAVAWSGSEYGIVWEDNRDGGDHEIYFARVSATGEKIGSDVRLTSFPGQSLDPEITWSGSHYGVSWHDDGWGNMEIGFMTLDAAGTIVTGPVRVTSDSHVSAESDIVWNGSAFAIVWRDRRTGDGDVYLSVVAPDGTEIVDDERITDTPGASLQPAIAWNGSSYGILWKDKPNPAPAASRTVNAWNLETMFVTVSCP
ncbi:MAG: hypothetical protein QME96_15870, partial [Myxococcota bacterium]|nr:hypothetical protein [Myxococcota bacterium]